MSLSMTMSARSQQIELFAIPDDSRQSSSEARHAKTSPAPTQKAKVLKGKEAVSTSKPSASSEKADLVGSLLKTALISELGELTPSSLHWRHSATPAGRSWYVLATEKVAQGSEPITNVHEVGSSDVTSAKLPTPVSQSQNGGMRWEGGAGGRKVLQETGLMDAIYGRLPTPMASDGMKDGKGGGAGSTYPFRKILATPRKTDADRGFRGDVLAQLQGQNNRHAGMLPSPVKPNGGRTLSEEAIETGKWSNGQKAQVDTPNMLRHAMKSLPTPTKRDKRMDAWSPAYDKRKSLSMDAVLDGAMTQRGPDKWAYARMVAAALQESGLTGPSETLPITYNWMMGFPPGWLARALQSAVRAGRLQQVSSLKRSETPSSRKSRKQ